MISHPGVAWIRRCGLVGRGVALEEVCHHRGGASGGHGGFKSPHQTLPVDQNVKVSATAPARSPTVRVMD